MRHLSAHRCDDCQNEWQLDGARPGGTRCPKCNALTARTHQVPPRFDRTASASMDAPSSLISFRRIQAGKYATADGRYLVEQEPYERECDCLACQSGGVCPRGGTATDWFWHIWDTETNDYAGGTHFASFETLREAKEWFA